MPLQFLVAGCIKGLRRVFDTLDIVSDARCAKRTKDASIE
jgi:hypothetical protein